MSLAARPLSLVRRLTAAVALCLLACLIDRWKWKVNDEGKDQFCRMCGEGDLGSVTCDRHGCKFMFCEVGMSEATSTG